MKVVSCESHVVATPPPHIGGMYWIFVKLGTACGIEGVGVSARLELEGGGGCLGAASCETDRQAY